jgi:hypothetical protein
VRRYQPIQRVHWLVEGELVTDYEHRWARDETGRLWIRKRELVTGVEVIAAEIIGWQVARFLDAPVPDAGLYRNPDEQHSASFLSAAIQPALHWDMDKSSFIDNIEDLGSVIAMDAIILNEDRHVGNLLLEPDPDELHLRLWSIDAGNALIGWPADFMERADDVPAPRRGLILPVERIRERAMEIAARAATIRTSRLERMVNEACSFTGSYEPERIIEVLEARCRGAPELVSRYLSSLPGGSK